MSDEASDQDRAGVATVRPDSPSGREKRLEVLAVALLALAALATAWSGYQASLWDGIQSSNYTQASGARTKAALERTSAHEDRIADLTVFENHIDALLDGNVEVAEFYRVRFRDEFEVAYEAWLALDPFTDPNAPASPFALPEYNLATDQAAHDLEVKADTLFAEGEDANGYSDSYTLSALLFAVVLFLVAVSERFEFLAVRLGLLALGGLGFVAGMVVAIQQPITSG